MIDDGQETLHVLKTIGDVTTTTTVAVGELCTRGAADDDVYVVREVRERQPADIHRLRLMGVVLEVGLVRRSPFLVGRDHFDAGQPKPQGPPPNARIAVRSEERRERNACVRTCRSRGSPDHTTKKNTKTRTN